LVEEHIHENSAVLKHEDNNVGAPSSLGQRVDNAGTEGSECYGFIPRTVRDRQLLACIEQTPSLA
jgi:hypothetical protein